MGYVGMFISFESIQLVAEVVRFSIENHFSVAVIPSLNQLCVCSQTEGIHLCEILSSVQRFTRKNLPRVSSFIFRRSSSESRSRSEKVFFSSFFFKTFLLVMEIIFPFERRMSGDVKGKWIILSKGRHREGSEISTSCRLPRAFHNWFPTWPS